MDRQIAATYSSGLRGSPLPSPPPPSRAPSPAVMEPSDATDTARCTTLNGHDVDDMTISRNHNDEIGAAETNRPSVDRGRNDEKQQQQPDAHPRRRWAQLQQWNPSLTLENAGSVARDHLASERTFLAYVRTSLAIASTGVGAFAK